MWKVFMTDSYTILGVLFVMLKVQYDIDQTTATGTCAVLVVDGER
jgi:hypothetical protein